MTLRQWGLLVLLAAIGGGLYGGIQLSLEGFSAFSVSGGRLLVGAVVLTGFLWISGRHREIVNSAWRDIRARPGPALLVALAWGAIPGFMLTLGQIWVPSHLAAILCAPLAIFAVLLAPLLDRTETITKFIQWFGLAIGFIGVALVVGFETVDTLMELIGALIVLVGMVVFAVGGFVSKRYYSNFSPLVATVILFWAAALITLPGLIATLPQATGEWKSIVGLIGVGVLIVFMLWLYQLLVFEVGVGRAFLADYLMPIFGVIYGAAFFSEEIGLWAIVGMILILAGTWFASGREAFEVEEEEKAAPAVAAADV